MDIAAIEWFLRNLEKELKDAGTQNVENMSQRQKKCLPTIHLLTRKILRVT